MSEFGNLKSNFPQGRLLEKFIDRKSVSAPRKNTVLQKIQMEKMRFQVHKYEKYLNSKNDIKRPLRPFIKEL